MYIITGGAGFIGANIVAGLNRRGNTNILVVDNLEKGDKFINLRDLVLTDFQDKREFRANLQAGRFEQMKITAIFHQGACSDTMEYDGRYMMDNNYTFSKELFHFAAAKKTPFVYASSAATYGASQNFAEHPDNEKPLNVYGYSKLLFDRYVERFLSGVESPVAGLRYFNVFGPREGHKGRMASMVHQLYNQLCTCDHVNLYQGSGGYGDGEQRRDFISVNDVIDVNLFFADGPPIQGIFNVGTGKSRSFNDIVRALSRHLGEKTISYVPMPEGLQAKYQNFTEADISRLRDVRYKKAFLSLEEGIAAFVKEKQAGY